MNKIWICQECKQQFNSRRIMYQHKREVHNVTKGHHYRGNYTCEFCKKDFVNISYQSFCNHVKHYCELNPNMTKIITKGHPQTEESKKKISEGMKKAHAEGRACEWIGRRTRSYAEQSWYNIFTNDFGEGTFENNFFVKKYFLDFAWPEKKIYFEVDGRPHFTEKGKEHDLKRTSFLEKEGWVLIGRCNWSLYQKMSFEEKENYIKKIESCINDAKPKDGTIMVDAGISTCHNKTHKNECKYSDRIDKRGRHNHKVMLETEWEERKKLILESNIDLSKFGWVRKVEEKTGLSKRQIEKTIDHFFDFFTGKIYRRK